MSGDRLGQQGGRTICAKRGRWIYRGADLIRNRSRRPNRLTAGNETTDPDGGEPCNHAYHCGKVRRVRGDTSHDGAVRMVCMMPGKAVHRVVRGRSKCANDREALYGHVGLCMDGAPGKSSE